MTNVSVMLTNFDNEKHQSTSGIEIHDFHIIDFSSTIMTV